MRFLIVDDRQQAAEDLARALRCEGHTVSIADSQESAWERAAIEYFDVYVIHLGLPDESGPTVLRGGERARAEGRVIDTSGAAIVAVAIGAKVDDARGGRSPAFRDYLIRPVTIEAINDCLHRAAGSGASLPRPN